MSSIRERFIEILEAYAGVDREECVDGTRFVEDLAVDSMDVVSIVLECEDEFGLCIPDVEAEKLTTIGLAVRYIESSKSEMSEPL